MIFEKNIEKKCSSIIGVILILIGIFSPFASFYLKIFSQNILQALFHIITGILFIWIGETSSKRANKSLGIFYLVISLIGFIFGIKFIGISSGNEVSNYLHLAIGLISTFIGYLSFEDTPEPIEHKHADMVYEE